MTDNVISFPGIATRQDRDAYWRVYNSDFHFSWLKERCTGRTIRSIDQDPDLPLADEMYIVTFNDGTSIKAKIVGWYSWDTAPTT